MTLPITLRPNCLQESVVANESTSTQLFGVIYIALTELVDYMVPSNRPWVILLSSGRPFPLGLQVVCLQVLKNPPQDGSLIDTEDKIFCHLGVLISKNGIALPQNKIKIILDLVTCMNKLKHCLLNLETKIQALDVFVYSKL
ncbi:hypothetical protein DSO57_1035922 [Entomophthora muscae]|uniref:Uncharacterized protein n=1 Tax=Entomophthora muscae TaxID=34485 RepID=A0ACC2TAC2_9FUNG|nr:hypothetical protein DSO57_1035922 [Entomophthora muscae]